MARKDGPMRGLLCLRNKMIRARSRTPKGVLDSRGRAKERVGPRVLLAVLVGPVGCYRIDEGKKVDIDFWYQRILYIIYRVTK